MMDLFLPILQLFSSQLINWWTGVICITCEVFISHLNSHSDGTHSLQRIHLWASGVMLHFFKSVLIRNKFIHLGWPEGEYIFSKYNFLLNHSFNVQIETLGSSSWTELIGKYLRTHGKTIWFQTETKSRALGLSFQQIKLLQTVKHITLHTYCLLVYILIRPGLSSTQVMMIEQHCNS